MKLPLTTLTVFLLFSAACAGPSTSEPEVTVLDFRNTQGAYILVHSTDQELRTLFEDRLVADLQALDIKAYASYPDIPNARDSNRENLLGAAKARKAMFVLVVEEVKHGETGLVRSLNPGRITHEHPTLKEFYEHTKPADHAHDDKTQVFVEVSAFLIQGEYAKLVWSGTTWSFSADGQAGRIQDMSATIANAIKVAQRKRRLGFE